MTIFRPMIDYVCQATTTKFDGHRGVWRGAQDSCYLTYGAFTRDSVTHIRAIAKLICCSAYML